MKVSGVRSYGSLDYPTEKKQGRTYGSTYSVEESAVQHRSLPVDINGWFEAADAIIVASCSVWLSHAMLRRS